jgi:hypothetical protein
MTFQEAQEKLDAIAAGRYHCIKYEVTTYDSGRRRAECTLYLEDYAHATGATWSHAFDRLDARIRGEEIDPTEAPQ